VAVAYRVGKVEVEEPSVIIAVSSAHRRASIEGPCVVHGTLLVDGARRVDG